jgi:hypothetical protein
MRSSPTPSSVVGQPPSVLEVDERLIKIDTSHQGQELDAELKILYSGHELNDLIMNEALDDKQDMLMEGQPKSIFLKKKKEPILIFEFKFTIVPALPAPNVHQPNAMYMSKSFSELLVPANSTKNMKGGPPQVIYQCLKKVKGSQSLAIALSWVSVSPFTFFALTRC